MTQRRQDSEKRKRRIPPKPNAESLRMAALQYLERFPASTSRLRQLLQRRIESYARLSGDTEAAGAFTATIEPLISDLQRSGILDDRAYAHGLARSLATRGLSTRMAAARMRARGLDPDTVADALKDAFPADDRDGAFAAALCLARKRRLGPFRATDRPVLPEGKALAIFARAGFDYETAYRAMRTDRQEAERILEPPG